ncbi:MAG TPA: ATP-binding protein [Burkholderiales bacterium]|nr:ATP-binding protein [Burkholderiales bacterium]
MKRLYLQLYVTVVASLIVFALAAGYLWRVLVHVAPPPQAAELAGEIAQGALPPPDAPREVQQAALDRLSAGGRVPIALYAPDGTRIAQVGPQLLGPGEARRRAEFPWGGRRVWTLELPDGRWIAARLPRRERPPLAPLGLVATLGLLAIAIAVGAYPVVRRATRRLERLKSSVEALGAGDLAARVRVEGRDEVAALAASFNRSAERIEGLVTAHKTLLANASHELRSPLARIRMAVEMLKTETRPKLRAGIERDIAELDALVDEILLASRLDAVPTLEPREDVDLLALAAEECARVDAALEGDRLTVRGDPRLLRRMIRNLLENARRHGAGSAIEVALRTAGDKVELRVCDRGPGVPEVERERIFEPFYRPAGAREREGGVGLGLALVRQIARRHGGEARCVAREGGGSCFEVSLPA